MLVVSLGACGGGDDDGGGVDARSIDATVIDGPAGAIDAGAIDAVAASACPAEPPRDQAICADDGLACAWLRCASVGYVTASCVGTTYGVTAAACEPFACGDDPCAADQLCLEQAGGALLQACTDNPCGEGPITPECACAGRSCAGGCTVSGRTVQCNTCPPDGPPCP